MPRTKSGDFDQQKYKQDFNNKFTRYRKASFNISNEDDQQMMDWIDAQPEGTSGYLKRLVKNDMKAKAN